MLLTDLLLDVVTFIGLDKLKDVLKNGGREAVRHVVTEGTKAAVETVKAVDEYRSELDGYLTAMRDQVAARNIDDYWARIYRKETRSYGAHECYKPGDEVVVIKVLVDQYRHLDKQDEKKIRDEWFRVFGHLTDQKRDEKVAKLKKDTLSQGAGRLAYHVSEAATTAAPTIHAAGVDARDTVNDIRARFGLRRY